MIFSQKSSIKCFHYLMLWLAVFDSLYILNSVLLFGIPALYAEYEPNLLLKTSISHISVAFAEKHGMLTWCLLCFRLPRLGCQDPFTSLSQSALRDIPLLFTPFSRYLFLEKISLIFLAQCIYRLLTIGQVPTILFRLYSFLFFTTFQDFLSWRHVF